MTDSITESGGMLFHAKAAASHLDKFLFFIALFIGAAGIIGFKLIISNQLIVTAWPMAVMLIYFFYILATKRFRLREDIGGDNLYYLGFLFTLTSLSHALYTFSIEENGTENIISNFGIALSTTICGLAFRVIMYQMRQDPAEVEREAREELGEAARNLKTELNVIVFEMNSFRRATQQSIKEGMEQVAVQFKNELVNVAKDVQNSIEIAVSQIESSFASVEDDAKKLHFAIQNTIGEMENLISRIVEIEVPADLLKDKLDPAITGITDVVEELKGLAKEDQKVVMRLSKRIGKTVDASELLDERIKVLNEQIEPLVTAVEKVVKISESVGDLELAVETVLKAIEKIASEEQEALKNIREIAERNSKEAFEKVIESAKMESEEILKILNISKESADQFLKQAHKNLENQEAALKKISSALEANLQSITGHNTALSDELNQSRALTIQVQKALTSMSSLIIEKLRPSEEVDTTSDKSSLEQ